MSENDPREELSQVKQRLAEARAMPPAPFPLRALDTETVTGVLHWVWRHDINAFTRPDTDVAPGQFPAMSSLARSIRDLANPLVSLADEIIAMASDCRAHGVMPIGINVWTEHRPDWESFPRNYDYTVASVHVDVTAVSRDWVTSTIHAAEQAKNPSGTSEENTASER